MLQTCWAHLAERRSSSLFHRETKVTKTVGISFTIVSVIWWGSDWKGFYCCKCKNRVESNFLNNRTRIIEKNYWISDRIVYVELWWGGGVQCAVERWWEHNHTLPGYLGTPPPPLTPPDLAVFCSRRLTLKHFLLSYQSIIIKNISLF